MKMSKRVKEVPYSAIRKLTPLANEAKEKGKKVYHLNIGAPDTKTPEEFFDALRQLQMHTLEYAPSVGLEALREKTSQYYAKSGLHFDPDKEIVITNGASEALLFSIIAITDVGDAILTTNPYYSNYYTVFKQCGISIQTFNTTVENGYSLPSYEEILSNVTDKTRAILLANPSNPTGAVYSEEEVRRIVKVAKEKNLFIIADEVYREFVFDGEEFFSFAQIEDIDDRLILLDSISKRFGACGARIGSIACKNEELMSAFIKLATSRLAVSTVDQIGASHLYDVSDSYFEEIKEIYQKRRDVLYEELNKIEGVKIYKPKGAFYLMPELPVEDTDDFAKWLLTDFDLDGKTIMIAPGYGFYHNSNVGKKQVRIAYVMGEEDLRDAINILKKALEEYKKIEEK